MTSSFDSYQHPYMLPTLLFTALIVLVTTAYAKLLRKGRLPVAFELLFSHERVTGRSKPLDPNTWKEFPLEKKIQVSPNTAMYGFPLI